MDEGQVRELADALEGARIARQPARLPSAAYPGLTLDDAYRVQRRWADMRSERGPHRIGYKVAITTPVTQRTLATDRPAYGILLEDMAIGPGEAVVAGRFIRPRIEMELAFVMRETPPANCTVEQALAAVDYVNPAFEIVDCRVQMSDPETGKARVAVDIIADGGATAGLMLSGRRYDPRALDLGRIGAALIHNGHVEDSGLFAIVMGAPERAVHWLANELQAHGDPLRPGDIILCGSAIKAYGTGPGDEFTADFGALGTLSIAFEREGRSS